MFANPPLSNTYLVARFHLSNASGSDLSVDEELLLPAERDRIRGPRAFALSYRDKALANALSAYEQREREHPGELAWPTAFGTDPLAPVSRWATTGFDAHLAADRQIRRTELWRADVPIRRKDDDVHGSDRWVLVDSRTWE